MNMYPLMKSNPWPLSLPSCYTPAYQYLVKITKDELANAHVGNNEIDTVAVAAKSAVELPRPDLCVWCKHVSVTADVEVQRPEAVVLRI